MREIKFRAWDNEMWEMKSWDDLQQVIYGKQDEDNIFNDSDFELMQYTGLKNKNGVEIYEGDIVWDGTKPKEYAVVKWDCGSYILEFAPHDYLQLYEEQNYKRVKVIGNIYENPNLLEAK